MVSLLIVSIYKTFCARLSQPLNVLSLCASAGFAHPPGHDIQPQRTARHALHSLSKKNPPRGETHERFPHAADFHF
jgi:hypothetical protein